jgi:hypothetical protein
MVLDQLGHQPIRCSTRRSNELQDVRTTCLGLQGTFNRLDLAADAAYPGQQLRFLSCSVHSGSSKYT